MSSCYWGVTGYGIDIRGRVFDIDKIVKNLPSLEISDEEISEIDGEPFRQLYDYCVSDILEHTLALDKFNEHGRYIEYIDTGMNEQGSFLYYPFSSPWSMDNEEHNISKEKVEDLIIDVLLEVTHLTKEQIMQQFEYINTGGMG